MINLGSGWVVVETPKETADFLPQIDAAKCIGCELCVKLCPKQALKIEDNIAAVADPKACDYVGACQEICPTEAISLIFEIF